MKLFLPLLMIFSTNALMAGPEDHISAQVCYRLDDTKNTPANVPSEICLESLQVDPIASTIYVYSYFYPSLYKELKVDSLIRQNEDFYSFKSSNVLHNEWQSGCGSGERVELFISGAVDFNGEGDINKLNIRVEQQTTNDTCHSHPQKTVFKYVSPFTEKNTDRQFVIEKGQRFAAGWYSPETQNMFTSYPYSKAWDGKISCGVNVQATNTVVDALFSKAHDFQYYYLALSRQALKQVQFNFQITPFVVEECLEYSDATNPEDVYCVRSRPVYGQNNSFEYKFANSKLSANVSCSRSEAQNSAATPLTEEMAADVIHTMLNVVVK